jgi:ATP-dependent Clp protease ATP-binding subunit ClpC
MRAHFTVGVYERKEDHEQRWYALVPAKHYTYLSGTGEVQLRDRMLERLRDQLRRAAPVDQEGFQLPLGTELVRAPVDIKVKGGRVHGEMPLVVEPRWVSRDTQRLFCYVPQQRAMWFIAQERDEIAPLAQALARETWADIDDTDDVKWLLSNKKDRLVQLAFSAEPLSLIDMLPSRKPQQRGFAGAGRNTRVLNEIGVDETRRVTQNQLPLGVPRSPYRERLSYLLGGPRPRSVAVIGPPGAGKTSLVHRWIADRLTEDGYWIHKNLDKCHRVWRLSGKRLIAGMSYLGQWEERCLGLLEQARREHAILWIEDLHLFGRLGQSRQSERSFADFFRGPVRRGDLVLLAELTPEQHARLERDAPGLAEALALVAVPAASPGETAQLVLHEVRALESRLPGISLHPFAPRAALELGAALFPWRARPGVAIEIVRRVVEDANARGDKRELSPNDVLEYLARTTGLSPGLLALDQPLDADAVEATFVRRVIGQRTATRAAADLVAKVRGGLADPGRPISVMLFTGPTGTGKTELATAIAEYLYGDVTRLVRVDMGEMSGPDAVARLIGDRWNPEGLLTSRVRAQPFCVVLLDEIEKAHPQVLHLLLQLFDEGRLTDAAGEVTSFASAVVIMTSNLGSRNAQPIGFGETRDRILADVARAVREFFPVELFNRIDRVVPFEPLTPEVAAKVVDKELGKLLARRGLREHNTFVYAGAAIRKRAVTDAFDPRYGARTVKRWLEDHVAGALTDLLAAAPPARLRIIRLADDAGKIAASLEPMAERTPLPGRSLLEGALDLATAALEPLIAEAIAALARVRSSHELARARAEATDDLRYYVDELEQRLAALEQRLGGGEPDDDLDEHERPPRRAHRAAPSRDELIAAIAEALLFERALPSLLDPSAHAVTVVLGRIGAAVEAHGFNIVASILAPMWFDEGAFVDERGQVRGTRQLLADMPRTTRDASMVLRGLFVREALATNHGTWFVRSQAAEPDIVRVEIRPGAQPAVDTLRAQLAGRSELDRVLEVGGALPPNPDTLLPVTRTIAYRAPLRPGDLYQVELEDFSTGWVDRGGYKTVGIAVKRAWYLAWSRRP